MKKTLSLLLALALCFSLAACGSKSSPAGPEDVVTTFCEALKAYDFDAMNACMAGSADTSALLADYSDLELALLDRMKECAAQISYTLGEPAVSGDTATVPVTFDYVDCTNAMTAVLDAYMEDLISAVWETGEDLSEDEALAFFKNAVEDEWGSVTNGRLTANISVPLVQDGGKWAISGLPEELASVISANMETAVNGYMEADGGDWDLGEEEAYEPWDSEWSDDWLEYEQYDGFGDQEPVTVKFGHSIDWEGFRLTFTDCRESSVLENSEAEYRAEEGAKFVIYDFTVENISSETLNFSNDMLYLYDDYGFRYYEFYDDYLFCEDYLWYTDIEPGETAKSTIVYYIPVTADPDMYFIGLEDGEHVFEVYGE